MPIRVGVIGTGYLGRHHARIYSALDDAELAWVSDIDSRRGEEIARTYGCRAAERFEELLPECNAVSIVTPTTTHYDISMECIRAGKDIFIEKPITDEAGRAKEIVEEAGHRNVIVQVGHVERYNAALLAAAPLIKDPLFIEAERLSPFLGRATDVDVTVDLMIHDIDIILSIAGSRLTEIRAAGRSIVTDKIDAAKAWLEFENGCKAIVTASRLSPEKKRTMGIFQRDSYISLDFQTQELRRYYKDSGGIAFDTIKKEKDEPLREELKDFVRCVRTREKPVVSAAEAADALGAVLLITEMINGQRT